MSRVPRIRFKGFEEDWEQRKLGEIYTQLVERNIELLPFKKILSVSTMTYKGDGNGAAEESLSSYKRLRVGDIAFEGHTSKDFRYGRFVLNDTGDGIMSPRFSALRPISDMPIKFWKYYIHYEPIMKKILVNSTKSGTMMNELVVEEFLKEILLVPKKHEQQKIGRFFYGIDHLITLHQRKLEKLKIIKKSMLENLFPQNEEKTPKIRFSGFTKDWEQRKLGEIADKVVEKNFQLQERDVFTNSAEFGIIDQKDFFDHEIVNKNNIGGYYIVSPNDFVYNPRISVTAPVGPINRNKLCKRGIMSPLYTVFHPRNMNETFLEFYFKTNKWHKFMEYNGDSGARSDRFSIKTELFYAMTIPFPSREEQSKVGICFESIDHLITLHQSKLEKLQKIKKSMLESMFV